MNHRKYTSGKMLPYLEQGRCHLGNRFWDFCIQFDNLNHSTSIQFYSLLHIDFEMPQPQGLLSVLFSTISFQFTIQASRNAFYTRCYVCTVSLTSLTCLYSVNLLRNNPKKTQRSWARLGSGVNIEFKILRAIELLQYCYSLNNANSQIVDQNLNWASSINVFHKSCCILT